MKDPGSLVPFSKGVKRSLIFIASVAALVVGVELYMLEQPDTIAPISHAFWFLIENAPWLPIPLLAFFAALSSHFFWFRRADNFWAPISLRTAIIISSGTLISIAATKAWMMLAVMAGMMGGVMFAHKYWFRLEQFDEHLAQFHKEDK